jgi:ankyrin repeat protein
MERTNNFQPRQPYIPPASRYGISKAHIPERKPDSGIANKMLLLASEGNYFKLKEFIYGNQSTMSSRMENGESALHLIIKNNVLTQHDKLQLIKFAVKFGAQVTAYDQSNVTPLHLAAKYQHEKIIEYLVDSGASINALDSQLKTPLFYSVSGTSTQCPSYSSQVIKPLIPKSKKMITSGNTDTSKLKHAIINYMFKNTNISNYIEHVSGCFDDVTETFDSIKDMMTKQKGVIAKELINTDIKSEDRLKKVYDGLYELKKAGVAKLTSEMKMALDPLEIHVGLKDGWGPAQGNDPVHRVMRYENVAEMYAVHKQNLDGNMNDALENLTKNIMELEYAQDMINQTNTKIDQTLGFSVCAHTMMVHLSSVPHVPPLLDPATDIVTDAELTALYYDTVTAGCYKPDLTIGPVLLVDLADDATLKTALHNINKIRVSKKKERELIKRKDDPQMFPLSLDSRYGKRAGLTHAGPMGADPIVLITNDNRHPIPHPAGVHNNVYFNVYYKYYKQEFETIVANINNCVNTIRNDVANDTITRINNIHLMHRHLIELAICTCYLQRASETCNKKLKQIKDKFKTKSPDDANNYYFLYEQLDDEFKESLAEDALKSKFYVDVYKSIKSTMDSLNILIESYNIKHALTIMSSFFNVANPDDDIASIATNKYDMDDIFNRTIRPLNTLSESSGDISSSLPTQNIDADYENFLFKMIVKYVSQVSIEYAPTWYNSGQPSAFPTLGYIIYQLPPSLISRLTAKLNHGRKTDVDGTQIVEDDIGGVNINAKFGTADVIIDRDKKGSPLQILRAYSNMHIPMIKYILTKFIINDVTDNSAVGTTTLKANSGDVTDAALNAVTDALRDTYNDLSNNISNDPDKIYPYITMLLGQTIDKILIEYVKSNIELSMSGAIKKVLEGVIPPNSYKTLLKFDTLNPNFKLLNEDMEFQMALQNNTTVDSAISDAFDAIEQQFYDAHSKLLIPQLIDTDIALVNPTVHKMYNFIYDTKNIVTSCFKIDPYVTEVLLNHGAFPNAKDILGNTPIFYASELQHSGIVKMLLLHNAGVIGSIYKNKMGKTPIDEMWDNYCLNIVPLMVNTTEIADNVTKTFIEQFKKKSQYGNNVPQYTKDIMHIALYMLNHQLYSYGKTYPNDYAYSEDNELLKFLGITHQPQPPLLSISSEKLLTKVGNLSSFEPHMASLKSQQENLSKSINMLNSQIHNLETEKENTNDALRIAEIDEIMADITKELTTKTNFNTMLTARIDKLKTDSKINNDTSASVFVTKPKTVKYSSSVAKIYEEIFNNINSANKNKPDMDLTSYQAMWHVMIKETKAIKNKNDFTQIVNNIFKSQGNIINDDDVTIEDKVKKLNVITTYYKKVINPFVSSYLDLQQELDATNIPLTKVCEIITHITTHYVFTLMYHVIIKMLITHVKEITTDGETVNEEYSKSIRDIVYEMLKDGPRDTSNLLHYMLEVLPKKATKVVLRIYSGPDEGEGDPDKDTDLMKLFDNITKMFETNTVMPIGSESSMITNLKDYVYPYFKDYTEMIILEMKQLIDGYLRALKYQANFLEIINDVVSSI